MRVMRSSSTLVVALFLSLLVVSHHLEGVSASSKLLSKVGLASKKAAKKTSASAILQQKISKAGQSVKDALTYLCCPTFPFLTTTTTTKQTPSKTNLLNKLLGSSIGSSKAVESNSLVVAYGSTLLTLAGGDVQALQQLVLYSTLGWATRPAWHQTCRAIERDGSKCPLAKVKPLKQLIHSTKQKCPAVPYFAAGMEHLVQLAQLAAALTLVQVVQQSIVVNKWDSPKKYGTLGYFLQSYITSIPASAVSALAYRAFALLKFLELKQDTVTQLSKCCETKYGSPKYSRALQLTSQLMNYGAYGVTMTYAYSWIMQYTDVLQMTARTQTLLAIGLIVLAVLASTGVAQDLLSGIVLTLGALVLPGDQVTVNSTTAAAASSSSSATSGTTKESYLGGTVVSVGLTNTLLRTADTNVVVSIPNTALAKEKFLSNPTRSGPVSSIQQTLRFPLGDTEKIPALLERIKDEISLACPELIENDASMPLHAHWTDISDKALIVDVAAHFEIPSANTAACMENKERVLQAINKAVKSQQMDFAE